MAHIALPITDGGGGTIIIDSFKRPPAFIFYVYDGLEMCEVSLNVAEATKIRDFLSSEIESLNDNA